MARYDRTAGWAPAPPIAVLFIVIDSVGDHAQGLPLRSGASLQATTPVGTWHAVSTNAGFVQKDGTPAEHEARRGCRQVYSVEHAQLNWWPAYGMALTAVVMLSGVVPVTVTTTWLSLATFWPVMMI